MVTQTLFFIKSYVLYLYTNNQTIPDVTDINFISMCFRCNSVNSPKGSNMNDENKQLLITLNNFYENHFNKKVDDEIIDTLNENVNIICKDNSLILSIKEKVSNFKNEKIMNKETVINMSQIISRIKSSISIAFDNNIKMNFVKYLKQYVETIFLIKNQNKINELCYKQNKNIKKTELEITQEKLECKNNIKEFKKENSKNIKQIIKDLLFNELNSHDSYKDWVLENREKLIPKFIKKSNKNNNSVYVDIIEQPSEYFKKMIFMNQELEKLKRKCYNCFSLRTNCIPNYIEIDTSSIINMFYKEQTEINRKNLLSLKNNIWNNYFNLNNGMFYYSKNYVFNHLITTDGVSANIYFIKKDFVNVDIKKSKNKNLENDNFKYIDDLTNEELKKINEKNNIVMVDPGKNPDLLYMYSNYQDKNNKKGLFLKYTTKERLTNMKTLKNRKLLKKIKKENLSIIILEKLLMKYNKKTYDYEKCMEYIIIKMIINKYLYDFYNKKIFRKINYRNYIEKLRTDTKLIKKIKEKFKRNNKEIVLIYGDWSRNNQMRGCISTPCIGLKRLLSKHFKIYNIDEYKTSCIDHYTKKPNINAIVKIKTKNKLSYKSLHSVLVSKIQNKTEAKELTRFQNRNRNAVLNMYEIYNSYLNKNERPLIFQRIKKESINCFTTIVTEH